MHSQPKPAGEFEMSIAEIIRLPTPSPQVWPSVGTRPIGSSADCDDDMHLLQRAGSKMRFDRGETIFNEGDPAEHAYRVVSGAVRLCKHMSDGRRQIAQFLLPGDFFSFVEMTEHSFTAEAVCDLVLACYPQRQITRLTEERLGLRRYFGSLLSRRVRDVQNHLVMLGRQTAKEKVASFLVMLIERQGAENSRLAVPMSRQDIADYLGLTIETVCRVLSSMKREKLIDIPGLHELTIRDSNALYALAEGEE
jgi:CRP-like cAMP-binding protein